MSTSSHPPLSAIADDSSAFEVLVAEHLPRLRARATRLCRGRDDPDDLVQDALIRAFRSRGQLRDRGRAQSWLLSIIGNTFIDAVRKQRTRPLHVPLENDAAVTADDATEPRPWHHLGSDQLRLAVDRLPDDVRDIYRMFALEGQDYAAIAAATGIPTATVGSRLLRARRKLRTLLSVTVTAAG